MSAKEIFEELGYEIDTTRETENHLYYGSGYAIIDFDLERQNIYKYNQSGLRSPIDMRLLQAINKQVSELGWLTPTIKMDDITISGEQFLKNIQRINDVYPTVKEQINKINDAVKRAKGDGSNE